MHFVVGHHCSNDQGTAVEVMDEVSITISEGDVVVFPLEMFYWPLVQVVDISDQLVACFLGILVLGPARLTGEMRSTEDSLNFA